MAVYKDTIKVQSHGKTPTYIDVTPEVKRVIEESGIKSGLCAVISPHTTCSVFFEEFVHDYNENGDEFLQEDLNNALAKIIPDHATIIREKNTIKKWKPGRIWISGFREETEPHYSTEMHI